jgi:tight adherence protein C
MTNEMILFAVFLAVLMLVFTILNSISRRREIARNVDALAGDDAERRDIEKINQYLGTESEYIRYYFEVLQNDSKDSVRSRLIRAGYFNRSAIMYFNLIRTGIAVVFFVLAFFATVTLAPATSNAAAFLIAMVAALLAFVIMSYMLEKRGVAKETAYRKLFPDFMDLLIVCVDAGLSIESAIDRVTREFLLTNPDFGTHLGIIELEVRAGRPMHEALANFGNRINLDEAKSLAVLFRQSEELGSSVSKTLRTFSSEMRTLRIIRAEEKANALPIKMLFPLAAFLFPVNLVIVLVPILITIVQMFQTLQPPNI